MAKSSEGKFYVTPSTLRRAANAYSRAQGLVGLYARLGVSQRTLSRWCSGRVGNPLTEDEIADALHARAGELMQLSQDCAAMAKELRQEKNRTRLHFPS